MPQLHCRNIKLAQAKAKAEAECKVQSETGSQESVANQYKRHVDSIVNCQRQSLPCGPVLKRHSGWCQGSCSQSKLGTGCQPCKAALRSPGSGLFCACAHLKLAPWFPHFTVTKRLQNNAPKLRNWNPPQYQKYRSYFPRQFPIASPFPKLGRHGPPAPTPNTQPDTHPR